MNNSWRSFITPVLTKGSVVYFFTFSPYADLEGETTYTLSIIYTRQYIIVVTNILEPLIKSTQTPSVNTQSTPREESEVQAGSGRKQ